MASIDTATMYKTFLSFVESGDEVAARAYLTDYFAEFPEDVQEKLAFIFFEDALRNRAAAAKEIAQMQKQGMQALRELAVEDRKLDDQVRIADLKKSWVLSDRSVPMRSAVPHGHFHFSNVEYDEEKLVVMM